MSKKSVVLAKFTRPTQTGIFLRKRLFEMLDRARNHSVVWISGLGGCGKTTLISSYVEACGLPCLWYQLDEGDADPATFFYYMGLAAKKAAPRKRKPLPLLTPEYLQGIPTFTLRYFENLYDRLRTPHLMVFDNYQDVPAAAQFHEVILNGLSNIPDGIHVFVLSRGDPSPAFARLRANNLMEVLGWNELRLTVEECKGIVRLRTEQAPSDEMIQELHDTTDGWAAGLILMLAQAGMEGIEPRSVSGHLPEELFDYFAREIFGAMDETMQEFLLKTALLPQMSAEMAAELSDIPHAGRILSELNRNNLFTERRLRPAPTYQYHPLFRQFLLSRANEAFSPEVLSALRKRAAMLLEEAGETGDAVALHRDGNNWDAIIEIIKTHAMAMLQQGRNRVVEEWLNMLPTDYLEHDPWLLFWKGVCRLPFDQSQSQDCFEKGFEQFDEDNDQLGMMLSWSGVVDSIAYALRDHVQLQRWIKLYEDRMPDIGELPPGELGARVASSMFMAMVVGQTDHPQIERWGEYVLSLADTPQTVGMKVQALVHLVVILAWQGNFQAGALYLDSLRELTKHHLSTAPLALISVKQAESNFYLFAGRYGESLKATFDGLELSRISGVHVFDNMLLGQGVDSALATGDFVTAEELLERMAPCGDSPRLLEACYYHTVRTRQAVYKQDFQEASAHSERATYLGLQVGTLAVIVMTSLMNARVMHGLGNGRKADEYLERALHNARRIKSPLCEFLVFSTKALFALDRGQEALGLQFLRKAMALASNKEYFHLPLLGSADATKLCMKALEADIEVEFVQKSIRTCALIPDEPPVHLENWPWSLKIYTLGRFGLIIDDQPVQFSRKAQQKLLNMLKVIIAFGGRDVKEERISDVLWPDTDGDLAHKSFAPTLHRLRKMIGYQDALQFRDGRVTLDQRYCWVDTWAFERIFGQAEAAWEASAESDAADAVALTQKAVGVYRGSFLADEAWELWTIPLRERLRSKFLRGVGRLGHHWETAGEWEKALECYSRALEADPLAEESYQRLMLCHQKLGRTAEALSVYEQCKRILSATLGITPSPNIEAIRKSLLSQKKS